MNNVPKFIMDEIKTLTKSYSTLHELYSASVKWLTDGTYWLKGHDLKLANWFNDNTELFEKTFIDVLQSKQGG